MPKIDSSIEIPNIEPATITRKVPVRVPEVGADVLVPLLWSVISGMFLFCAVGAIALSQKDSLWLALILGFGFAGAIWFYLIVGWSRMLNALEVVTGQDLNRDGQIGEPRPIITIEVASPDSNSLQFLHLPTTPEKLKALAQGVIFQDRPLSEAQWTGSNAPFSKREFRDLMAELTARGIVVWRDPNYPTQGRILTAFGRRVFGQLCVDRTTHARMSTPGQGGALLEPGYRQVGEWGE